MRSLFAADERKFGIGWEIPVAHLHAPPDRGSRLEAFAMQAKVRELVRAATTVTREIESPTVPALFGA